ncbi:MAG: EAL domain-containing protein [Alphaproteobacteria bacterium]|nr:EAL domain-containing protein [Alphaproteobacteria bacterium]
MMPQPEQQSDDLHWASEDEPADPSLQAARPWRVLVVDDDDDVHQTTRFALARAKILGRPIDLIHAHSAAEAREVSNGKDDIAVALVDVVMETPDAGLKLVGELRDSGHHAMRIVLRTGQPGYAPELSVISEYEIDDYRTKAELTRARLLTILTAAIRAYDQICTISRSRSGLEMIVESAIKLYQRTNLELFSRGVLTQIAGLLGVDPNGIVCVSSFAHESFEGGYVISATGRFDRFLGMPITTIDEPEVLALIREVRGRTEPIFRKGAMALSFGHKSGRELSIVISVAKIASPEDQALLKLFSTNIAIGFENLSLVERLDHLAYADPVLEIPNLNAFESALDEARAMRKDDQRVALVNIDTLPSILASYSSRVANGLLKQIHTKLSTGENSRFCVARVGDGTFAMLGCSQELNETRISSKLRGPFRVDDVEIAVSATSALIDIEDKDTDAPTIMRMANAALLHVMQTQRGACALYDAAMRAEVEERMALQRGLKRDLERGLGFAIHLQPIFSLQTSQIVSAEALLRWSFNGKAVSPSRFIPLAEAAGLTPDLTDVVLRLLGQWTRARAARPPLRVAVNLSMADLNNPGFGQRLLRRIAEEQLSPATVSFEVTEGIAMQDKLWAIDQVRVLKDAGYSVALDDFGTGYSSLGYFSRLPISTLKIDRSFVSPLEVRTARSSLAAIVISMAQTLNVDCVAEGIETREQLQALQFLGCRMGQGFLLSPPVPIDEFEEEYPNLVASGVL